MPSEGKNQDLSHARRAIGGDGAQKRRGTLDLAFSIIIRFLRYALAQTPISSLGSLARSTRDHFAAAGLAR